MNTLSDTDERGARASVWPVYVAAGVLVAIAAHVNLPWVTSANCGCSELRMAPIECFLNWLALYEQWMPSIVWGLLGFVAACGLVCLRPWWWCAVLFAVTYTAWGGLGLYDAIVVSVFAPELAWPAADYITEITPFLVAAVLLMVVLATRRRLFFPPKQEGEE